VGKALVRGGPGVPANTRGLRTYGDELLDGTFCSSFVMTILLSDVAGFPCVPVAASWAPWGSGMLLVVGTTRLGGATPLRLMGFYSSVGLS
jgi:hypothetical protein